MAEDVKLNDGAEVAVQHPDYAADNMSWGGL